MSEIKIFQNNQFGEIRTATTENGEPLFCLADVCKILDIGNVTMAKSRLNQDGVSTTEVIDSMGRTQQATFINESNLYKTIFQSRKPEAEEFTEWVTSEVLPSIRKTGGYIVAKEEDTPEVIMARALFVANDAIERHKKQLEEKERQLAVAHKQIEYQAPIITYANEILSSTSDHTATTIAAQFNMSAVILNRLLLKAGFIRKTGNEYSLSAKYQGQNYTNPKTCGYDNPKTGERGSRIDLRYTEKGRKKIYEIIERAKVAGVLKCVKGRYFINNDWKPKAA